jgi:hypothetical protein
MYLTAERLGSSPARNTCVPLLDAAREAASMNPASATFLAGSVPLGPKSNTCAGADIKHGRDVWYGW